MSKGYKKKIQHLIALFKSGYYFEIDRIVIEKS